MVLFKPDDVGMVHTLMQIHFALYFLLREFVLLRLLVYDFACKFVAVDSVDQLITLPESSLDNYARTLPSTLPML